MNTLIISNLNFHNFTACSVPDAENVTGSIIHSLLMNFEIPICQDRFSVINIFTVNSKVLAIYKGGSMLILFFTTYCVDHDTLWPFFYIFDSGKTRNTLVKNVFFSCVGHTNFVFFFFRISGTRISLEDNLCNWSFCSSRFLVFSTVGTLMSYNDPYSLNTEKLSEFREFILVTLSIIKLFHPYNALYCIF